MKLLRCLAVMCFLLGTCYAQLPEYYQTINRVMWISPNVDGILPPWTALGMTDIHKSTKIQIVGTDHGKPTTIDTWQATGRLGNLTVNFLQPAEGQSNSYNDFLKKHKEGIFSVVHEVPSRLGLALILGASIRVAAVLSVLPVACIRDLHGGVKVRSVSVFLRLPEPSF